MTSCNIKIITLFLDAKIIKLLKKNIQCNKNIMLYMQCNSNITHTILTQIEIECDGSLDFFLKSHSSLLRHSNVVNSDTMKNCCITLK